MTVSSSDSPLVKALRTVATSRDLTADEAAAAIGEALTGGASDVLIAAFLTALRIKGETADELAGAVRPRCATRWTTPVYRSQPSDCSILAAQAATVRSTVNVSTAAALVVAACGVAVAKHGNRAASGNSGSAEVLAELGIAVDAPDRRREPLPGRTWHHVPVRAAVLILV